MGETEPLTFDGVFLRFKDIAFSVGIGDVIALCTTRGTFGCRRPDGELGSLASPGDFSLVASAGVSVPSTCCSAAVNYGPRDDHANCCSVCGSSLLPVLTGYLCGRYTDNPADLHPGLRWADYSFEDALTTRYSLDVLSATLLCAQIRDEAQSRLENIWAGLTRRADEARYPRYGL